MRRVLAEGDRVTGLRAFSTGHSNETYLIEGLDQILRLPATLNPLLPDAHPVPLQAKIYDALSFANGAPPVPQVVFQSDNNAMLGDPFFVMARVAGEEVNDYNPQLWFAEAAPGVREAMCRTWIEAFADVAGMVPLDALGEPVTPEDELCRWQSLALEARCPELAAQFDRLLSVPSPRSGQPSPVHGDPKFANLMWDDGKLSAVLDWELAYNGDPLADLGYMLYFFESEFHPANGACKYLGMLDRNGVIALWSEKTGRPANDVAWHEVAAVAKMAAMIGYGYNLYTSGKSDDARFLRWKERLDINTAMVDAMLGRL